MNAPSALWEGWKLQLGLKPDWHSRICAVAARVRKSTCMECGREDYSHHNGCRRGLRSVGIGNSTIKFHNDVADIVKRREFRRQQDALMAQLREALR